MHEVAGVLGLLQTLPRVVAARSFFGRAMQFAAAFHGPVFTRGLERMQGATGPFWGHNAIVRLRQATGTLLEHNKVNMQWPVDMFADE